MKPDETSSETISDIGIPLYHTLGNTKYALALEEKLSIYQDCVLKSGRGKSYTKLPQRVFKAHGNFRNALAELDSLYLEILIDATISLNLNALGPNNYERIKNRLSTVRSLAYMVKQHYVGEEYIEGFKTDLARIVNDEQNHYFGNGYVFYDPTNKHGLSLNDVKDLLDVIVGTYCKLISTDTEKVCAEILEYELSVKRAFC